MSANRFLSWLLLAGGALMAGVAGAQPIERWTQPDGARVLFVPSHQNPIIDIRIDVDAGSRREAPERLGVAALTNRLLVSQLEELFESFISLINLAIDEKSPYTGGHCQRVPALTMMLAEAAP